MSSSPAVKPRTILILPFLVCRLAACAAGQTVFAWHEEGRGVSKNVRFFIVKDTQGFRITGSADVPLPGDPAVACRRVRVKIEGLPAKAWSGDYFFRADNGSFLRYEGSSFGSQKPPQPSIGSPRKV
jgi:hypothetical protein